MSSINKFVKIVSKNIVNVVIYELLNQRNLKTYALFDTQF